MKYKHAKNAFSFTFLLGSQNGIMVPTPTFILEHTCKENNALMYSVAKMLYGIHTLFSMNSVRIKQIIHNSKYNIT